MRVDFPVPGFPLIQRNPPWFDLCEISCHDKYSGFVRNQRHVVPWAGGRCVRRSSIFSKYSWSISRFLRSLVISSDDRSLTRGSPAWPSKSSFECWKLEVVLKTHAYLLHVFFFVGASDRLRQYGMLKGGLTLCHAKFPVVGIGHLSQQLCEKKTIAEALQGCEELCHTRCHGRRTSQAPSVPG